ncbi:hypothetical protein CC1G_09943 [Coprinopsis cinerea okayama7|uniref:Secreted protein n=1 Tax=Coprinopsis cinerea (strain Okayama-7 / 130 / ATCC MYA-4618 / FGSC 9003) TaxID=240176 RepID=A8PGP8_COPC7|nr:hypothetical protein CC1G_09943 [Coprinopsis cinerea okayama7\|eukprot:XP_001841251.2 hypothetical protein CC1G_09943 [Coprinopsis cinerea okayama7\
MLQPAVLGWLCELLHLYRVAARCHGTHWCTEYCSKHRTPMRSTGLRTRNTTSTLIRSPHLGSSRLDTYHTLLNYFRELQGQLKVQIRFHRHCPRFPRRPISRPRLRYFLPRRSNLRGRLLDLVWSRHCHRQVTLETGRKTGRRKTVQLRRPEFRS